MICAFDAEDFAQRRGRDDCLGRAIAVNRPVLEHDDAAGVARSLVEVVQHHDDGQPMLSVQVAHEVEHLELVVEVEEGCRLVQEEHLRASAPMPSRARRAGVRRPIAPTSTATPSPRSPSLLWPTRRPRGPRESAGRGCPGAGYDRARSARARSCRWQASAPGVKAPCVWRCPSSTTGRARDRLVRRRRPSARAPVRARAAASICRSRWVRQAPRSRLRRTSRLRPLITRPSDAG